MRPIQACLQDMWTKLSVNHYLSGYYIMLMLLVRANFIGKQRVPYTLSDNRIKQNYLAFLRIMGNLKQDFTFTKKSKFEFMRM